MARPNAIAPIIIDARYIMAGLRPNSRDISVNDAKLAAGPAIRSTRAVPGERPFIIKDKAIGMEPVAQTYIGIAIIRTAIIENIGLLPTTEKKSAGTYTVISAAIISPPVSHPPMLPTRSMYPYFRASIHFCQKPAGDLPTSVLHAFCLV